MKKVALEFALKLANPCLVSSNFIPVLNHYCFADGVVYAYDDVSAIIVELKTGLDCALHGETLARLVALAGADVTFEVGKDEVTLVSGTTKARLPSLSSKDFLLTLPEQEPTLDFKMSEELLSGLALCTMGVSEDPLLHKEWTAVTIRLGANPALYAHDGVGLAKFVPSKALGKKERFLLVPESVCEQIASISTSLALDASDIGFGVGDDYIRVDFASEDHEVYLIGKLLPEKAPDFDGLIETIGITKAPFKIPAGFADAVQRVAIVVGNEMEPVCKIAVEGKKITVSGQGSLGASTTALALAKDAGKGSASVDPLRVLRYKETVDHMLVEKGGVAMYGGGLSYFIASYADE